MMRHVVARASVGLIAAVAAVSVASAAAPSQAPSVVDIKAPDGIVIKGSFYAGVKPGPGLLLMHACNRDRTSWDGLAKAAAAQGYHVLAIDFRGFGDSGGPRFAATPEQQATITNTWPGDVDAAFSWLTSQAGVDKTRIAAGGASCGVNQSVQLARRHPEVRTVVLLSGNTTAEGRTFIRDSAWLPIFAAASHGDAGAVATMKWTLAWSRSGDNKFLEYKAAGHGTDMFAVEKGLQPAVLAWLDARLRNAPTTKRVVAATSPTIAEKIWTTLNEPGGIERGRQMYEDERRKNTKAILLPEVETNLLGYQLMQNGNTKDALTILKMNNEAYPASANTYDSVSDALLAAGDRAGALKYATKAIEMLEKDAEAPPEFKQLVRESAEKKIKELKS